MALEDHFGSRDAVPPKRETVVRKGERVIDERIKVLKLADKGGWLAVDKYQSDPLCDGSDDDKR